MKQDVEQKSGQNGNAEKKLKCSSNPADESQVQPFAPEADPTKALLKKVFKFNAFRPYQEAVCRSVISGKNVLLVMPTGAGKSLCYQLPGLARDGTTLVVSPLIALMEDQVAKLKELGLRAERIHSGRDRLSSRQICFDYLDGKLDFLFIAPERLRVPKFPEMLAKRPLGLIAIDEAHCISQWGHDFRPDYRMLKERLPLLGKAPIIALTATATARVQDDIIDQLGISGAERRIHGFRRSNIAVEIVETSIPDRTEAVIKALSDKSRLPAIVYAPTRRDSEALAEELQGKIAAAAYHAGMTAQARNSAQTEFLQGKTDAMVATIAFGMGIDKSNVRTVIHTGLPSSIESYYQQIGRAGRDGLPSRAILMHSYADRRMHEFFHQKSYPDSDVLDSIYSSLSDSSQPKEKLRAESMLDPETFDTALDKLWIHGGAIIDPEENVTQGSSDWKKTYLLQRSHKLAQIEAVARFVELPHCRMLKLVQHFGDVEDSGKLCGKCDACAPADCILLTSRKPEPLELEGVLKILDKLRRQNAMAVGRLYRETMEDAMPRRNFEELLTATARAGLVKLMEDSFEKEGRTINFRRAVITVKGLTQTSSKERLADIVRMESKTTQPKTTKKRQKSKTEKAQPQPHSAPQTPVPPGLVSALKEWRLAEARRLEIPAFRILSDKVLRAIAAAAPKNQQDLLELKGFGPKMLETFGEKILKIVSGAGG